MVLNIQNKTMILSSYFIKIYLEIHPALQYCIKKTIRITIQLTESHKGHCVSPATLSWYMVSADLKEEIAHN